MGRYHPYPAYKNSDVAWLGDIPEHWTAKPLKFLCTCNDDIIPDTMNSDYEIEYIDISSVSAGSGITKTEKIAFSKAPSRARRLVQDGDVIISTVRTYLEAIAPITNPPDNMVVSTGFAVIRPKPELNKSFAAYCLRANGFIKEVIARSVGVSYPTINSSALIGIPIPNCPYDEQIKIVAFLDSETAKIDQLIDKQKQLIELLNEKRQVTISHAVSKGLHTNVTMKHSGVPWLGKIPVHWEVKKFKYICESVIAGPFGSSITKNMYCEKGFKVYGQEQVIPNDFSIGNYYLSEKNYKNLSRYAVKAGDILISCVGTFGKIAVFPCDAQEGIINPRLIKATLNANNNPDFMREFLKSDAVYKQFELLSRGGTMGVINIAILNEIMVVIPPHSEQCDIIHLINKEKERYITLIEKAENQINLLKERRAALISAAVTGKIDIRQWQLDPSDPHKRKRHEKQNCREANLS